MARVWLVRAGGGDLADEFRADKHISIGWNISEDLSGVTEREGIEAAYRRANPEQKSQAVITRLVGQIDTFLNEIEPGDHVLTPRSDHKWLMHGVVMKGPPYFVSTPKSLHQHGNRRPVAWRSKDIYRYSCVLADQKKLKDRGTIASISENADAFLASIGTETADAHKLLQAIKDRLSWEEFQDLVASLLGAMGCENMQVAPPGPDGGVDITAVSSDVLTPGVPLFVQVKHYKIESKIRKKTVRDLRASIQFGGRGVFVTTSDFVKSAFAVAAEPGFPHIALINGSLLVELLKAHWLDMRMPDDFHDRLDAEFDTVGS